MKNIGPGIAPGFVFENELFVDTNHKSIFSKRLHFGRLVVPNHIFNAYNYQIDSSSFQVFSDIYFFHKIINFRCFFNEMKKVKNQVFFHSDSK
jgi:hypothetical protein